jgi:Skp family chaperone for outer membrane proteins
MSKELIAKLTANEAAKAALGDDGLKALTDTLANSEALAKKFADAEAKAGRILSEKKEAQEKLSAMEAEIETLKKAGMTDADKTKSELDKYIKRAEKAEKDLVATQTEFAKAKRTVTLDKVASMVKFIDAVNPEAGRTLLEASLAAVPDLSDAEAVAAALVAFKESHKTLIAADSQASGGGTGRPSGGGGTGQTDPTKMSADERAAELKKHKIIR